MVASLEAEEETHKTLAVSFSQDGAKALKAFTEAQVKTRDPVCVSDCGVCCVWVGG